MDQYAMYHSGMDIGELRQQLSNCADGALEDFMYDSLGSKVDTISLTDLFQQLEELAVVVVNEDTKQVQKQTVVPEVEKAVYDALDSENDTLYPTDVIRQIKEQNRGGSQQKQEVCLKLKCCHCHMERVGARKGAPKENQ